MILTPEKTVKKNRISSNQIIDVIAVEPRKFIYEETYRIIKKESNL